MEHIGERMIIECLKNKKGQWFWRMKARNGKILAHSESYSRRGKCWKSAMAVLHECRSMSWWNVKIPPPASPLALARLEKYFLDMKGPITDKTKKSSR